MSTPQYYCFRADGAKVPLPDISAIDEIKKDALTCYTEKRGVTVNGNAKMTLGILGTNKTLPLPAITVLSVTKSADGSTLAFNSCSVTITQSRIKDAGGGTPGNREVTIVIQNHTSAQISVVMGLQWLKREYGDPFPVGEVWP